MSVPNGEKDQQRQTSCCVPIRPITNSFVRPSVFQYRRGRGRGGGRGMGRTPQIIPASHLLTNGFQRHLTKWVRPNNNNDAASSTTTTTTSVPSTMLTRSRSAPATFSTSTLTPVSVSKPVISTAMTSSSSSGPLKPIVQLNPLTIGASTKGYILKNLKLQQIAAAAAAQCKPQVKNAAKLALSKTKSAFKVDNRKKDKDEKSTSVPAASSSATLASPPVKNRSNNFIIKTYSMKRIRKSSSSTSSFSPRRSPPKCRQFATVIAKVSPKFKSRFKIVRVGQRKGESVIGHDVTTSPSKAKNLFSSAFAVPQASFRQATKAVQRSRQRLSQLHKKKNTFCLFYSKFGVCKRKANDICPFTHDPRQVLICSEFLKSGACRKGSCTLSHDLAMGKKPVCKFFKQGVCTQSDCPFRHVENASPKKKKKTFVRSPRSKQSKPVEEKPKDGTANEDNESNLRYFEVAPASQPIISVIPRRLPKDLQSDNNASSSDNKDKESVNPNSSDDDDEGSDEDTEDSDSDDSESENDTKESITTEGHNKQSKVQTDDLQNHNTNLESLTSNESFTGQQNQVNPNSLRRQRLLQRLQRMRGVNKPELSTKMPTYLGFK